MSLPHFFLDDQVIAHVQADVFPLELNAEDRKHAQVLRLAAGEHIAVVDAASDYFECELVSVQAGCYTARVAQHLHASRVPVELTLVQGIAKGEKMDSIIRHATEVGVGGFIPFSCERSIVKLDARKAASRTQRWQSIARSAAMQSGQPRIPVVSEPCSLQQLADALMGVDAVLVCWEEAESGSIREALQEVVAAREMLQKDAAASDPLQEAACPDRAFQEATGANRAFREVTDADRAFQEAAVTRAAADNHTPLRIAVVVGPEGGLTKHEVETLLGYGAHGYCVSRGASILRTETAGLIAPALVIYEAGGLGAPASIVAP